MALPTPEPLDESLPEDPMSERSACCSCGQLALTVSAEPVRISVCHCLACQRRTGSVFAEQAWFPKDAVETTGTSSVYVRVGDEGGVARFHFCPTCASIVHYTLDAYADRVAVPVGAFADPTFPPPRVSVYEERKHPWVTMPVDMEHID